MKQLHYFVPHDPKIWHAYTVFGVGDQKNFKKTANYFLLKGHAAMSLYTYQMQYHDQLSGHVAK